MSKEGKSGSGGQPKRTRVAAGAGLILVIIAALTYLGLRLFAEVGNDFRLADRQRSEQLGEEAQEASQDLSLSVLAGPLSPWIDHWKSGDPSFRIEDLAMTGTERLDGSLRSADDGLAVQDTGGPSLIALSPSHTRYVDIYSYHMVIEERDGKKYASFEPDSEVVLVDLEKKERQRLLFAGTETGFDEAVWLDEDTVAVAGHQEEGAESGGRTVPLLWLFRLRDGMVTQYAGRPAAGIDPLGYLRKKYPDIAF